ncbi:MAG: sodium/proton-translocating pyrophosphatase, partial [Bryobacteraceae bacterium]
MSPAHTGGEANLLVPDLSQAMFFGGLVDGRTLLLYSLIFVALGLLFGLAMYRQLRRLPVHRAMLEVSELIYETCKTYLAQQVKFLILLEIFVGLIIIFYFGVLEHFGPFRVFIILLFSVIGICGSSGVALFGIRVNTFANSRAAFASLRGRPFPSHDIPLKAGIAIGMLLVSV